MGRVASWALARQARLLAEFARRRPGDDPAMVVAGRTDWSSRYAPDEIGVALRLARGTAQIRLHRAARLATVLPATLDLWEQGLLDERKVAAICDTTVNLTGTHATAVQDRVLPKAPRQTVGQLRAALARAVIAVDPKGSAHRHQEARNDRRVAVGAETDGMASLLASLWALLPASDAVASYEWLTRLARGLGTEDPRGMDARRADLMVELLTGKLVVTAHSPVQPVSPGKPLVQVVVALSSLRGEDDHPADLVGHGPITAQAARDLAADAVWHRLVTDPLSGTLLDYGRTTYHPPVGLADHIRARDLLCRFPGCRRRVANGELDHVVPFPDGPISEANVAGYCVHHHHLKHEAGWQVTVLDDGELEWISPTGHRYVTEPHDYRPDAPAPPPATEDPPPF